MRVAILMGIICLAGIHTAAADPGQDRLNVILVTADAMRADMLGANGNQEVLTPHLDALASQGVNFRRAYCNITTTSPSHASLLSSLYPRDHKAYSNTAKISSKIVTLSEILQKHGWYTATLVNFPWAHSTPPRSAAFVRYLRNLRLSRSFLREKSAPTSSPEFTNPSPPGLWRCRSGWG